MEKSRFSNCSVFECLPRLVGISVLNQQPISTSLVFKGTLGVQLQYGVFLGAGEGRESNLTYALINILNKTHYTYFERTA